MPVQTEVAAQPVSLWRNHSYILLWSGQAVSTLGSQVSQFAFPLLVLYLTKSPVQAGLAAATRVLPYFIFSLPAGALLDRWDRKRVMIICDAGRALSLASIPLAFVLNHLTLIQLYLVSLTEGTLFVFFNIAQVACLPHIVPRQQITRANAQNLTMTQLLLLVGPSLGGILYSLGRLLPFLADAVSYTVSVFSLMLIRTPFQKERAGTKRHLWMEIKEGLLWLWRHPHLRFLALLTGGGNFVTAGFTLIAIVMGQNLHASPFSIGLAFTIGGIGGIAGALVAPWVQKKYRSGWIIIAITWLGALLWLLFASAPNLIVLGIILAANLILSPIFDVIVLSYRMVIIPDELQGRTNSVFRLLVFGAQPLGLSFT
ncbi:MAG TPA: MFS transporter, partial [Ktedonobacteraceae bacterium]